MSNGGQQQQHANYVETHTAAHAALQQHMAQQAAQARLTGAGPHAASQPPNPTFTLPDDGLGYDDGVRVLRSIGTWYKRHFDFFKILIFFKYISSSNICYFHEDLTIYLHKCHGIEENIRLY